MPNLIQYGMPKRGNTLFDLFMANFRKNKPNVKYKLSAEYYVNGKKRTVDCGQITSGDPVIFILYLLLSNSIYSSGKGVSNPTVAVFTSATGTTNVNASTSWISTTYNLGGATSGSFSIKFSTTISSAVSGTATISNLSIGFTYGQNSSGTLYSPNLTINTQGGTACNISVSAGSVVTWTLSGSVSESNSNATASWYVMLWNEFWAEFIASTGVSGAPTGLWNYPSAGTALFSKYSILLSDPNGNTIGAYNVPNVSNTAITSPTLNPGSEVSLTTTPSITFTFTPTSSDTLQVATVTIYVNGTPSSTSGTEFNATGGIQLSIGSINQSVTANTPYQITMADSVTVGGNT
jgi:hypothetical protein